ncbi:uncharacterized protein LOC143229861 isoform X3 [Tachypleus tridentatus]|uniref:uncharacterized protein LOC143229861 isoform X3 n=1 Tax=Tachypleus tridentatus TaxID=6853 RepID=UPI003FD3B7E7
MDKASQVGAMGRILSEVQILKQPYFHSLLQLCFGVFDSQFCRIIHRILHLTLANYDLQNLTVSLENRIQFILREKLLGKTDQWTVSEENLLEPIFSKEQELKEMKKKLLEAQKELQAAREVIHHLEQQKERTDKIRLDEEFG